MNTITLSGDTKCKTFNHIFHITCFLYQAMNKAIMKN